MRGLFAVFFVSSAGRIRTSDQSINSRLRYRCATAECIELLNDTLEYYIKNNFFANDCASIKVKGLPACLRVGLLVGAVSATPDQLRYGVCIRMGHVGIIN